MLPFPIISHLRVQVKVQIQKFVPYIGGFVLLDNQGNLYVKGTQEYGQFGVGSTAAVASPTLAATGVSNFWICDRSMIIAKNDGTFHAAGSLLAQYGSGTASSTTFIDLTARLSAGLSTATEVHLGTGGGIIVRDAVNDVYVIGTNNNGFLGIAAGTTVTTWTKLSVLSNIVQIQLSADYCVAKKADNTLWAWGYNNNYAFTSSIGDSSYTTPIKILSGIIDYKIVNNVGLMYMNSTSVYIRGYVGGYFGLPSSTYINSVSIFSVSQPFTFNTNIRFIKDDSDVLQSVNSTKAFIYDGTAKYYACGVEYNKCFGINSTFSSGVVYKLKEVITDISGITSMNFYGQAYTVFMKDGILYGAGNVSWITGIATDTMLPVFQPIEVQVN